jgi:predicted enzyme related to lactoylglutathione lyase
MFTKFDHIMANVLGRSRPVAFYRDILGLSLKFESPGWGEFRTGATTVAPHQVRARGGGEGRAPAGACSIGFSVEDLETTHRGLAARGARLLLAPTEQANEGIRLAVCADSDGLTILLAEPLTREPQKREG